MWTYNAEIVRVVDGDTYDAFIDLGFYIYHKVRIRLHLIDTPEIFGKNASEEGKSADEFVRNLISGKTVKITTTKIKPGPYNRWEAKVTLEDGTDLGATILEEGHGEIDERFL